MGRCHKRIYIAHPFHFSNHIYPATSSISVRLVLNVCLYRYMGKGMKSRSQSGSSISGTKQTEFSSITNQNEPGVANQNAYRTTNRNQENSKASDQVSFKQYTFTCQCGDKLWGSRKMTFFCGDWIVFHCWDVGIDLPSPQWKTIQSQQEKCHFVGSPQFVPTSAGKGVLQST